MSFSPQQIARVQQAQDVLGYTFNDISLLVTAFTHPSAVEENPIQLSYERLEFLGDSILGAIVADEAFRRYPNLNEGGLTRIKVSLVSGATLSKIADRLGFAQYIVFGSSERGTGKRGLHSALENVYEAVVAALYLDGGIVQARNFVAETLFDYMSIDLAKEPENPKSALQEKLQTCGITPTYELVETVGPPHDRTFKAQVLAENVVLALSVGRTKKEAESNAANLALKDMADQDVLSYVKNKAAE